MTSNRSITTRRTPARFLAVPLLAAALVLVAACGSDSGGSDDAKSDVTTTVAKGSSDASADSLDGMSFVSDSVTGYDLVEDTELAFTFTDGSLAVQAGCNTQTSSYTLKGDVLKWSGKPAASMMACEEDVMAQDQWIAGLLTEGMEVKLDDRSLTLTSGDVTIELEADTP